MLPVHFKNLLVLFEQMDVTMNFLKSRKTPTTFHHISQSVQSTIRKTLNTSHFQQIVQVAPGMFNHRWELRGRGYELVIEVPRNIRQVL